MVIAVVKGVSQGEMPEVGLEPTGKTAFMAPSAGGDTQIDTRDASLNRVIAAWPTLPDRVRRAVLRLVEGSGDADG